MTKGSNDKPAHHEIEGFGHVSRAAFCLHGFGSVSSVRDGHPGFVSDSYLASITAETTTAANELVAAGLWQRREGGYFIVAADVVQKLITYNEEQDRRLAACDGSAGHLAIDEDGSGWVVCGRCGELLQDPAGSVFGDSWATSFHLSDGRPSWS